MRRLQLGDTVGVPLHRGGWGVAGRSGEKAREAALLRVRVQGPSGPWASGHTWPLLSPLSAVSRLGCGGSPGIWAQFDWWP